MSIGLMNRVDGITKVCGIPKVRNTERGDFPVTVQFASKQRAVIFDGVGNYHVALVKKDKWVIIFSDCLVGKAVGLSAKQIGDRLHVLARTISEPKFVSFLEFFVLDDNWVRSGVKKIQVRIFYLIYFLFNIFLRYRGIYYSRGFVVRIRC